MIIVVQAFINDLQHILGRTINIGEKHKNIRTILLFYFLEVLSEVKNVFNVEL